MKKFLQRSFIPSLGTSLLGLILAIVPTTQLTGQTPGSTEKGVIVVTTHDDPANVALGWQIGLKLDKTEQGAWVDINNNGVKDEADLDLKPNKRTGICGVFVPIISTTITIHANAFVIDAPQHNFTKIDLSGCPTLEIVNLYNNLLQKLDVSKLANLKKLRCFGNKQLAELNVTQNANLVVLEAGRCANTELDVTHNKLLESLDITEMNIKTIDCSQNKALKSFVATRSTLESLELKNMPSLKIIDIVGCNGLKTPLDVSTNANLEYYYFAETGWKDGGNFAGCNNLHFVACYLNNFDEESALKFAKDMPDQGQVVWVVDTKDANGAVEHNYFNTNAVNILRNKGWQVRDFQGFANEGEGVSYDGEPVKNSILAIDEENDFVCAPTIVNNSVTLYVPADLLGKRAVVYTYSGEVVMQVELNNMRQVVDTSLLPPNSYIVDVEGLAVGHFTVIRR